MKIFLTILIMIGFAVGFFCIAWFCTWLQSLYGKIIKKLSKRKRFDIFYNKIMDKFVEVIACIIFVGIILLVLAMFFIKIYSWL